MYVLFPSVFLATLRGSWQHYSLFTVGETKDVPQAMHRMYSIAWIRSIYSALCWIQLSLSLWRLCIMAAGFSASLEGRRDVSQSAPTPFPVRTLSQRLCWGRQWLGTGRCMNRIGGSKQLEIEHQVRHMGVGDWTTQLQLKHLSLLQPSLCLFLLWTHRKAVFLTSYDWYPRRQCEVIILEVQYLIGDLETTEKIEGKNSQK